MKKSINSIWNNGFSDGMALSAPAVLDFYQQKSNNLLDKFDQLLTANHKAVLWGASFVFIVLSLIGAPVLATLIFLMLAGVVYVGKQHVKSLQKIHKDQSCLDYLKAFDRWLTAGISMYVKVYRIFYPALFALCALRLGTADFASKELSQIGLISTDGQMTLLMYIIVAGISILLGVFAGTIYRADVNLVYGKEIQKLKELIAELNYLNDSPQQQPDTEQK